MKPIIVVILVMITMSASPSATAPADNLPEVFGQIDSMIVKQHYRNLQQLDTTITQLHDASAQYQALARIVGKYPKP
ncbi:hypothetical protein [Chitinophaga sp. CB10]|uniref:hypothetical protein n=1 Tax=Chitinophaga sp. CB10 TaxID=1891659 RepID=UPI0025C5A92F|nr:hypothetical protein [Chitinophaga sp. CB10]